jgi:predicted DNA-binding WGR domain protein
MTNLASASRAGKRNANRFEPVRCQACGRSVKRKSRQQRYCSDRCRKFASRENAASQINARTALKNRAGYQDSRPVREPILLSNKNNSLQRAKSRSNAPFNILGGYRWPNAVCVDRGLLRKIIKAEVGGL